MPTKTGALFRPVRDNTKGRLDQAITAGGVYRLVRAYSAQLGFEIGAHALRATAATNVLNHQADITKVQEWLGHAKIATKDSPTFKVTHSVHLHARAAKLRRNGGTKEV